MKQKHFFKRFFFYHLCIMIPFLMVSMLMAGMLSGQMKKMRKTEMLKQLDYMEKEFLNVSVNYFNESSLLSSRAELSTKKMLTDSMETYNGIELLRLKSYFDNQVTGVFIDYGTDMLYSSIGTARKNIYFGSFGYTEESIAQANLLLDQQKEALGFLYTNETDGAMMLTYAFRKNEEVSTVNFLMSFDTVKDMVRFSYDSQWYLLKASNGSRLAIGRDEDGNVLILAKEEWESRIQEADYEVLENNIESLTLETDLYYKKNDFNLQENFYQIQVLNIFLIVIESITAAMISYKISKKRINEIIQLEKISSGQGNQRFSEKSAYNQVQNIILKGLDKTKQLEKHTQMYAKQMKKRNIYMLFSGMLHSKTEIHELLQEIGQSSSLKNFFVGAIYMENPVSEELLSDILEDKLHCQMVWENMELTVFLWEFEDAEDTYRLRKNISETIQTLLQQYDVEDVKIGMSRCWEDLLYIDSACKEAVSVLNYSFVEKLDSNCICLEDVIKEEAYWIPDKELLNEFSEQLRLKDYASVKNAFLKLMQAISFNKCSEENKNYVKYSVLQLLVDYLNENNIVNNVAYIKKCLNVDVKQEEAFQETVLYVLKHCIVREKQDNFAKILEYIKENYQRRDLTYEEVAEVGGVSKTYLSKLFKTRMELSYIEYLMSVRMEQAAIMLEKTDQPINEIAKAVGYEDVSGFRKGFKKLYGISASDYRKKLHEETI